MEAKPVEQSPEVVTPLESAPAEPELTPTRPVSDPNLDDYYLVNPFFYDVANYFGVEQKDFDIAKEKLAEIVDWAKVETKNTNPGDILLKIRELENSIEKPEWGERRFNNVYKYVRLASQKQSIEKAMSAFRKEI